MQSQYICKAVYIRISAPYTNNRALCGNTLHFLWTILKNDENHADWQKIKNTKRSGDTGIGWKNRRVYPPSKKNKLNQLY